MAIAGQTADGVAQLRSSLEALHALRSGLTRTMFLSLARGGAAARRPAPTKGWWSSTEGFAHAEQTGSAAFSPSSIGCGGELLAAKGNEAAAESELRRALDVARQQQARSFELRAAVALARLLHASDRDPGARAVLEPVLAWFTEGRDTVDLIDSADTPVRDWMTE